MVIDLFRYYNLKVLMLWTFRPLLLVNIINDANIVMNVHHMKSCVHFFISFSFHFSFHMFNSGLDFIFPYCSDSRCPAETLTDLESLDDTLENERLKIRLIQSIPTFVISGQSGLNWMSFIGIRILLSQLSQKFMLLWEPSIDALSQIVNSGTILMGDVNNNTQKDDNCGVTDTAGISMFQTPEPQSDARLITSPQKLSAESNKRHHTDMTSDLVKKEEVKRTGEKIGKQKKRRRVDFPPISQLHAWLWNELQKEVYLSCQESETVSSNSVRPSVQYTKMRRRVRGRFHKVDSATVSNSDDPYAPTQYSEFWRNVTSDDCDAYR